MSADIHRFAWPLTEAESALLKRLAKQTWERGGFPRLAIDPDRRTTTSWHASSAATR